MENFKVPTNSRRSNDEKCYLRQMYIFNSVKVTSLFLLLSVSILPSPGPSLDMTNGSNVLANWAEQAQINTDNQGQTPGKVQYCFTHSLLLDNVLTQHFIAYVMWSEPHPNRNNLGQPLEVWYKDMFQTTGASSYVPIQRISNKFIFSTIEIECSNEMIVCPLIPKYYF